MYRGAKKLMSFLLALAVLLAPLEFAAAHDMDMMQADSEMAMQHEQYMDHSMADESGECDGQSSCNDCVYCSPAVSVAIAIMLDQPETIEPETELSTHSSIDLPVEYRPPRPL